jgi:hypothetical protein
MIENTVWWPNNGSLVDMRIGHKKGPVAVRLRVRVRDASIYADARRYTPGIDLDRIPWPEGMELEEVKKWAEAQYLLIKI